MLTKPPGAYCALSTAPAHLAQQACIITHITAYEMGLGRGGVTALTWFYVSAWAQRVSHPQWDLLRASAHQALWHDHGCKWCCSKGSVLVIYNYSLPSKPLCSSSDKATIGTEGNSPCTSFILYLHVVHRKVPYIHSLVRTNLQSDRLVLTLLSPLASLLKHRRGYHHRLNHLSGSTDTCEPHPGDALTRAGNSKLPYRAVIGKYLHPEKM